MRRNALIILSTLIFAALGAMYLSNSRRQDEPVPTTQTEQTSETNSVVTIDPSSLLGPYKVELFTTGDPNGDIYSTALIDARGSIHTTIQDQDKETVFMHVDSSTFAYLPNDEAWLKIGGAGADGSTSFSTDDVSTGYTNEDIKRLVDVQETGTEDCGDSTCRVYTATNSVTNEAAIVKIEDTLNRIVDIELTAPNGKKTTINYNYSESIATITAPKEFKEFYSSGTLNPEDQESDDTEQQVQ